LGFTFDGCYDLPMIRRLDTVYVLYHVYNWKLPFLNELSFAGS
jgi:hypothetical protein